MKGILYILPTILFMVSCGKHNNKLQSDTSQMSGIDTVCTSIEGQWLLEHVVASDTLQVLPADIDPEIKLYAHFYNDSTFNFQTGCNTIGGRYVQNDESIAMSDMIWTEMACEDMKIEELLKDILPHVSAVDWNNDSIVRLNTPNSAYIVLKKCETNVKCVEPELSLY